MARIGTFCPQCELEIPGKATEAYKLLNQHILTVHARVLGVRPEDMHEGMPEPRQADSEG
jgi:hypothetical protein